MKIVPHSSVAAILLALGGLIEARAAVVINEIMYRPGSDFPENIALEFIELHNTGTVPVDIGGWALTSGVPYTIPAPTTIAAGGYLVIASNPAQVQAAYGITGVRGPWTAGATLSNNSEKVVLSQPGAVAGTWVEVDEVNYATEGDWATRSRDPQFNGWEWTTPANGGERSMELRNAALTNDNGQNWAPSTAVGGATPGAPNSVRSTNIAPIIRDVKHSPAVPRSTDLVTISCRLSDETAAAGLSATLFWREATTATPGAFQSQTMSSDGSGNFATTLAPRANLAIVEFYVSATDGTNTRTWPAPTTEGQNANCQYQVDNAPANNTDAFYRLVLTAAENNAFNNVNSGSDRQFNQTLIVTRGAENTIRYRSSMRIRGNSSRQYMFRPLRVSIPNDSRWEGITDFNLNPRAPHLQYLGFRMFQAAGLAATDSIPVELRRNGVEQTTSSGGTPDFGKWVRVEELNADMTENHWPTARGGNLYKKGRPDEFWRSGQPAPSTPDGTIDGWSKQNNSAANDWSDLTSFFQTWQTNALPHFPGAPPNNVAAAGWNGTPFTAAELANIETVSDLDQWARWFAVMTILADRETNISNGQDDDYAAYFVPSPGGQRRLQLLPHDLDTLFGLGDTPESPTARGLFDATDEGSVFPTLLPLLGNRTTPGNAVFVTKYFTALRELFGGVFDADTSDNPNPAFYQFVDNHLAGWVPAATITAIKTFATQRQAHLLSLIGAPAITPTPPTSAATFTSAHGPLMIHEVLANNVSAVNVGGAFPDIIELRNTSAAEIDLAGMSLTNDPAVKTKFVFPGGTVIPAGGFLLVYADGAVGTLRTGFPLSEGGETIELYDTLAAGQTLLDTITFGHQPADYSIGRIGGALDSWTLCTPTFGADNNRITVFGAVSAVRLNEWLGNPDYQFDEDFIELYNPSAQPVALGGTRVTNDFINFPSLRTFPPLTYMAPSSFLRLNAVGSDADPKNSTELPFKVDTSFGFLALIGQNGAIGDLVDVVSQAADTSTGRNPNGGVAYARFGLPTGLATPGASNTPPPANVLALMNQLRITELLFTPTNLEFVELYNLGPASLDLSGVRFTNGITYTFPAGTTLSSGAFLVVCRDRAAFQAQFGPGIPLAPGVFTGSLDNSGERIAFQPPAPWNLNILNFEYDPEWYPETNAGFSLTMIDANVTPAGEWDEKIRWSASSSLYGTPGSDGPPTITSLLNASGTIGAPFSYQITATKNPISYNATPLPAGLVINTATGLINGTPTVSGPFSVNISATNAVGTDTKTLSLNIAASGPLASFAWGTIASPQQVNTPFPVTITALDAQGRTVTSFNGNVNLTGSSSTGGSDSSVLITEVGLNTPDYFEIQNVTSQAVNTAGWFVTVNNTINSDPNEVHTQVFNLPASTAVGQIFYRTDTLDNFFGENIQWSATRPGWCMLVDNTGGIRDFVVWGYSAAQIQSINFVKNGFTLNPAAQNAWSGASIVQSPTTSHVRTGSEDRNTASDFVNAAGSRGVLNAGLMLPFGTTAIPISPTSVTFSNGVFSGNISAGAVADSVRLTANDGAGHSGLSNAFNTTLQQPPAITSPASALAVVGQPFSYQILSNPNATSYDATPLPAALVVNQTTGLISGTPSAAGTTSVGISATNAGGTGNGTLSLEVQPDADLDGMGDGWEVANGLNPGSSADANTDLDGDGQTNRAEWLAGTAANNSNSRFAIISQQAIGNDFQVTWLSVIGKRYRVLARTDLTSGTWTSLTPTPIIGRAATTTFTYPGGATGPARFYRIEIAP